MGKMTRIIVELYLSAEVLSSEATLVEIFETHLKSRLPQAVPVVQKDVPPSRLYLHDAALCISSTIMQILWGNHAKTPTVLPLAHSTSRPHTSCLHCIQTFMDVRRLTFCLAEYTPLAPFFVVFSSFLPFFFLAFALGRLLSGHLFTLDRPCCDSWLQRATSFISHSSEGGGVPFSAALKAREGTKGEFMKKRGGMRVWKGNTREKEDPFLTAGDL